MKIYCSNCNSETDLYFQSQDYNRHTTREIFNHYRCRKCNLIFISPIPENLNAYYPQSYHFVPESIEFLEANTDSERYKIEIIQRYAKQGRLLEIGPSLGCFINLAKNSGFITEAIEMDERCSKFLNEKLGIPTINSSDTSEALDVVKPFDIIAMWHVIEHLPDPWKTLEAISKKINPNGILVIAAPNPDALQFRLLKRYWPHVDAPRHLTLIPPNTLVEKLESLGMRVRLITTNDEGGLGWNIFGWEFFFSNLCTSPRINKFLRMIGRNVAKLLSPIEKRNGKGSAYTMVFQKVS